MTTIKNTSGKKGVNIIGDAQGRFHALHVQYFGNNEQVINRKGFETKKGAINYAHKILGI